MKYGQATCLPHRGKGVPLSALPKDKTSKLASLFSILSLFYAERQAGKPSWWAKPILLILTLLMGTLRTTPQDRIVYIYIHTYIHTYIYIYEGKSKSSKTNNINSISVKIPQNLKKSWQLFFGIKMESFC